MSETVATASKLGETLRSESAASDLGRVLVLAGGLTYERDVSLRSGRRVVDALKTVGTEAVLADADSELLGLLSSGRNKLSGRGYAVDDLPLVQSLGAASGYQAVLVLALYINSTASEVLYRRPQVLWLLCPLLLYWISRVWVMAHRGLMREDPVVFAATDRASQVILLACAAVAAGAI